MMDVSPSSTEIAIDSPRTCITTSRVRRDVASIRAELEGFKSSQQSDAKSRHRPGPAYDIDIDHNASSSAEATQSVDPKVANYLDFPPSLTSFERRMVHLVAELLGKNNK